MVLHLVWWVWGGLWGGAGMKTAYFYFIYILARLVCRIRPVCDIETLLLNSNSMERSFYLGSLRAF